FCALGVAGCDQGSHTLIEQRPVRANGGQDCANHVQRQFGDDDWCLWRCYDLLVFGHVASYVVVGQAGWDSNPTSPRVSVGSRYLMPMDDGPINCGSYTYWRVCQQQFGWMAKHKLDGWIRLRAR